MLLTQESCPFFCLNLSDFLLLDLYFCMQVSVGPFTVIKSIDRFAETFADMLSAERKGFMLSTKNIGNDHAFKENVDFLSVVCSKYRRPCFRGIRGH